MSISRALEILVLGLWCAGLAMIGCGGDDGESGVDPESVDREDVVEIAQVLRASSGELDLVKLLTGGGEQIVEGEGGRVVMTLTKWTFEQYSPNGQLVVDGELVLNVLAQPITLKGVIQISGSQEGTAEFDMTVDLTDPEEPVFGGTVTYNQVPFQVAELLAETGEESDE